MWAKHHTGSHTSPASHFLLHGDFYKHAAAACSTAGPEQQRGHEVTNTLCSPQYGHTAASWHIHTLTGCGQHSSRSPASSGLMSFHHVPLALFAYTSSEGTCRASVTAGALSGSSLESWERRHRPVLTTTLTKGANRKNPAKRCNRGS